MATAGRNDPYLSYRFRIEIDGIISGGFAECSGIQAETEYEEYREGGVNDYVHRLPKVTKYPNLTFKRGITDSEKLWDWYQNVVMGKIERKNGAIILLDSEGNEKWRWNFKGAYPVKWTGPDLKADSNAVAFETLELTHTGITK
ncbi:phage tail protein [Candidatus Poribacteria bacterium]|nr:phage tail protein [Candidatus Poribacteria bacterium]